MKTSPYTTLWQQISLVRDTGRADLHLHTTHSDGTHSPTTLVERAMQAGLKAVAVTDHDNVAAYAPTCEAASGRLDVIPGVEITCEHDGSELHLLGYFFDVENAALLQALEHLRVGRRRRILAFAERLSTVAPSIVDTVATWPAGVAYGRRHLAKWLIEQGVTTSLHDAFTRLLGPLTNEVPKTRLPVAEGIALVRAAGGVTSWAHPPSTTTRADLVALQALGLQAVEAIYPWPTGTHGKRLREWASDVGLAITGGSDSHDPGPATRSVGAKTVTLAEVARIRALATMAVS